MFCLAAIYGNTLWLPSNALPPLHQQQTFPSSHESWHRHMTSHMTSSHVTWRNVEWDRNRWPQVANIPKWFASSTVSAPNCRSHRTISFREKASDDLPIKHGVWRGGIRSLCDCISRTTVSNRVHNPRSAFRVNKFPHQNGHAWLDTPKQGCYITNKKRTKVTWCTSHDLRCVKRRM